MKYCRNCGNVAEDGNSCARCGAEMFPVPQQPAEEHEERETCAGEKSAAVLFFSYIGLMLLFLIPFVGFISGIVAVLIAKDRGIRAFALASVVLRMVLVLALIALFALAPLEIIEFLMHLYA